MDTRHAPAAGETPTIATTNSSLDSNAPNLKVIVVAEGSPNAEVIAEVLNSNGIQAAWINKPGFPNPFKLRRFNLIYGIHIQNSLWYVVFGKLLGKRTLVHIVGSDAYQMARERSTLRRMYWRTLLRFTDIVLYVSPHLKDYVKRQGFILPFPMDTVFPSHYIEQANPDRDILYYCPGGARNSEIYRLSWIKDYAIQHPDEKITIVGNSNYPAEHEIDLPNVIVVPYVERREMPAFYRRHKKLIRMTTQDGLPRMLSEALLCGLQVAFNGKEVKHIPAERDPQEFARSFKRILASDGKHTSLRPAAPK